ncbi:MAG: ABC transporter ATP-binding protein [Kiritimatiellaeota bacterium]|nr:ABC transporter ATP-binding protein [Kiritimatiellota bacterium]
MHAPAPEPSLDVQGLSVGFQIETGTTVEVLTDVSFRVFPSEIFALVGESGCGKSVTCLALTRLLPSPPARHLGGAVRVGGRDVYRLGPGELRKVRGHGVAYVFQEPATALNPVRRIGPQIAEAVRLHSRRGDPVASRVTELLHAVGIPEPERCARAFPHQLSGGMKQRVALAMALAMKPGILVADEPTTALDVTVQAQILELLRNIRDRSGMAIILVTHDLGIVSETADRVAVMYAGRIVEIAPVDALFRGPRHPYTRALLEAVPRLDTPLSAGLTTIPGRVPTPREYGAGCRFANRCPVAKPTCSKVVPQLKEVVAGHASACLATEGA